MDAVSTLITSLSNFAWPLLILGSFLLFRKKISQLLSIAIGRVESASEIEFGGLKIKGAVVSQTGDVIRGEASKVHSEAATKKDIEYRDDIYKKSRNLFLVHTIKPTDPKKTQVGLPVFDVSVYLTSHMNRGKINDVESVTYYFGDKWGNSKYGTKYIVESANNFFALTAQMWGSCWCIAAIKFHNERGTTIVERYLDVEMAPVYGIPLEEARHGTP